MYAPVKESTKSIKVSGIITNKAEVASYVSDVRKSFDYLFD
jgi:hypothetical protein